MALFAGQIADRYDLRAVIRVTQIAKALAAASLALGSHGGFLTRELIFAILFIIGIARAFEMPTLHALLPDIVPQPVLPRAIAASAPLSRPRSSPGRRSAACFTSLARRRSIGLASRSS